MSETEKPSSIPMIKQSRSWGSTSPSYRVDFQVTNIGKTIASSKRRIRFRFGFSDTNAIEGGLQGVECRGEEHEINLIWSVTGGRRTLIFDNREIHCSDQKSASFEYCVFHLLAKKKSK